MNPSFNRHFIPGVPTPLYLYKLDEYLKNARREYISQHGGAYNQKLLSEYLERLRMRFIREERKKYIPNQ